jgi:hypothetical protein
VEAVVECGLLGCLSGHRVLEARDKFRYACISVAWTQKEGTFGKESAGLSEAASTTICCVGYGEHLSVQSVDEPMNHYSCECNNATTTPIISKSC